MTPISFEELKENVLAVEEPKIVELTPEEIAKTLEEISFPDLVILNFSFYHQLLLTINRKIHQKNNKFNL